MVLFIQRVIIDTKFHLLYRKFFKIKIENLNQIYISINFMIKEGMHFDNLMDYYNDNNLSVINYKRKVEHDGYDAYGPESNLYYLMIFYKKKDDYNFYIDFWSREYWFYRQDDDDEPYEKIRNSSNFYRNVFIDRNNSYSFTNK